MLLAYSVIWIVICMAWYMVCVSIIPTTMYHNSIIPFTIPLPNCTNTLPPTRLYL